MTEHWSTGVFGEVLVYMQPAWPALHAVGPVAHAVILALNAGWQARTVSAPGSRSRRQAPPAGMTQRMTPHSPNCASEKAATRLWRPASFVPAERRLAANLTAAVCIARLTGRDQMQQQRLAPPRCAHGFHLLPLSEAPGAAMRHGATCSHKFASASAICQMQVCCLCRLRQASVLRRGTGAAAGAGSAGETPQTSFTLDSCRAVQQLCEACWT